MSFIEFIGFIITFLAMIFLFGRQAKEERRKRQNPEEYEREQARKQKALQDFYAKMNEDSNRRVHYKRDEKMEEEDDLEILEQDLPPVPKSPPPQLKTYTQPIQKEIVQKVLPKKEQLDDHNYGVIKNKKEMLVMYTIFGPPKAKNDWRPLL